MRPPLPENVMALALLEMTEITNGDVLEQLLVISAGEAAPRPHHGFCAVVNRIRLFAQIDDGLLGVPAGIHDRMKHAALLGLDHFARCRRSKPRERSVHCWGLLREERVQELQSHSLDDSIAEWLRRPRSADFVLLEVVALSQAAVSSGQGGSEMSFAKLHERLVAQMGQGYKLRLETDRCPPGGQILLDAAAQRAALAAQWLTSEQVSDRLGWKRSSAGESPGKLRREGRLLGVYVADPVPSYRYPPWQLRADGQLVAHLSEILGVLRESGPFQREPNGLRRTTGWGEAEWFLSPHALLDGAAPASALIDDPARVLRVARVEFGGDALQSEL